MAVAATLLALLLCEGATRIAGIAPELHRIRPGAPESAYRHSDNPILGYEFKASYRNSSPDLYESFPFTNAHGQRDLERTVDKPAGRKRVLVLGDSVVVGHGLRDVRETIPLQLGRLLENRGVEVLNFGVGGYCTLAEVELLRVKGLRFQPDVVVVFFVANDFYDTNGQLGRYRVPRPGWAEWLFVNSHLYRTVSMKFDWHGFRTELDPEEQSRQSAKTLGNNVERGLALLNRLASETGFECVMFIWPQFMDEHIGEAQYGPQVLHGPTRIEQIAAEHGIETHKLSRVFLDDIVRRTDELGRTLSPSGLYTIGDGLHPSPTGAAVAAAAMAEVLSDPRWGL